MGKISPEKLSKELSDILVHRDCVQKAGRQLSEYLKECGRGDESLSLILRCELHDISKLQNWDEFKALASIIDSIAGMRNPKHVQTEDEIKAKELHWKNNRHHPEHFKDPSMMTDLDIMEMACDCFARNKQVYDARRMYEELQDRGYDDEELFEMITQLQADKLIEYLTYQQQVRFHLDETQFYKLMTYTRELINVARRKKDLYIDVLDNDYYNIGFDFNEKTIQQLEQFDADVYEPHLTTSSLYLNLSSRDCDFGTEFYNIYLKSDGKVLGSVIIRYNGEIEYTIVDEEDERYLEEVISLFIDKSSFDTMTLYIDVNDPKIEMLVGLGFDCVGRSSSKRLIFQRNKELTPKQLKLEMKRTTE